MLCGGAERLQSQQKLLGAYFHLDHSDTNIELASVGRFPSDVHEDRYLGHCCRRQPV